MDTRLVRAACIVVTALAGSGTLLVAATRSPQKPARSQPKPGVVSATARQESQGGAAQTPSPLLRQEIRRREQFLNLLIRREDRLIGNRYAGLRVETRLIAALGRVNQVLTRVGTNLEPFRRLADALGLRIAGLRLRLDSNYARLVAGLGREGSALGRLVQRAPNLPALTRIQDRIARQAQQVADLGRPAATPIRLPR